jgi:hypothetical protein
MTEVKTVQGLTDRLVIGQVYFRVTYPDIGMKYPLIESFVFLGMNFSDEDLEDTWYFQSAEDFSDHGSALDGVERPVSCATLEDLFDFEDLEQLSLTLKGATARRVAAQKHKV